MGEGRHVPKRMSWLRKSAKPPFNKGAMMGSYFVQLSSPPTTDTTKKEGSKKWTQKAKKNSSTGKI